MARDSVTEEQNRRDAPIAEISPAWPGNSRQDGEPPDTGGGKASPLLSVFTRALLATIAATASAVSLFLLSRALTGVPYDWLNLAEAMLIPLLVAFPIAAYIFYQTDRLARAQVDLARHARDSERQKLLIHELNHRIKNVLGTVMSICTQTARGATEIGPFVETFNGRLVALASAHDVLSRQERERASLSDLSAKVLAPYRDRIDIRGPQVLLSPAAAVSLSLVLHELATNAAKHGSLSGHGRVAVTWGIDGTFILEWAESGGPALGGNPARTGFGSRLIRHVAERELGGSIEIEYRPEGLLFVLRIPPANLS